ncbi:sterol carrier protein domain-containing protein, partial [Saccharothrix sp. MB29]|nr:sterol carrier protein domain-containing protein [Saccharothrix sp. MB29]
LWARSAEAWADLWLFVLGVDLVDRVEAPGRPVDEPVEWLLGDRRACRLADLEDESWLRLLDVPAALAARAYRPAPSVVVAVRDAYLPENAGSYRISAEDAVRTGEAADLVLDVDALASVYLGDVSFGTLAGARRLEVATPGAAARATRCSRWTRCRGAARSSEPVLPSPFCRARSAGPVSPGLFSRGRSGVARAVSAAFEGVDQAGHGAAEAPPLGQFRHPVGVGRRGGHGVVAVDDDGRVGGHVDDGRRHREVVLGVEQGGAGAGGELAVAAVVD